ncbi:restriction endonuclease subunit S [Aeromonas sp. Prich7-2]|uniref:restriction endonuclease subunit S n=1 Tax=Aeromonas sp. Prich7-2 TaxID=2823361 RepID=UPI001B3453EF|nr:restriction endonuclease subunit S [Aeromonas sp. Prich7-2]MBP4059552.1 restriction endonuclease subunit S [Aeromonas sp. Prich7-2]
MGLELITYSISDIGKVITGKTPPASVKSAYSALDGVPFVTPKDMDGRRWIENTERYLTSDGVAAVKRNLVPAMSVAVSCIGSDMGKAILLKKESVTNQQINSIIIDVKRFNPKYIYYVLSTKQQYLKDVAGGSATPILNKTDFGKITFQAPSKYYQDLIVEYLDCLDSKRELNRQVNQTLEQMAQALFKSWFVDFDPVVDNALDAGFFDQGLELPDELLYRAEARDTVRKHNDFKPLPEEIRQLFPAAFEECSEPSLGLGGWVPQGWVVSTTGDEFTVQGGSTPSTTNPEFWEGGHIHWTSPKDLSGSTEKVMLDTERKITDAGLNKITSGLLPTETVLMSSRAPIGYLALTKIPVAINQGYIAIPVTKRLSQEYVLYWLNSSIDEIKGIAGGTTFAEISKKTFKSISLVIPNAKVVDAFTVTTKSYLNKMALNAAERSALEKLRDTLLPKLISGELRLDDIEADIAEEGAA